MKSLDVIDCPHCHQEIQLKDFLKDEFNNKLKKEAEENYKGDLIDKIGNLESIIRTQDMQLKTKEIKDDAFVASKVREAVAKKENELTIQHQKELKVRDLKEFKYKQDLESATRRVNQTSMETQGEAGEILIEEILNQKYPNDKIEEIKKGARGADCILHVGNQSISNSLIIESKTAKSFNQEWIEKLRIYMKNRNSRFAMIITDVMPAGIKSAYKVNNIWIVYFHEFLAIVDALRQTLLELNKVEMSKLISKDKKEKLLNYITSPKFGSTIEAICKPIQEEREILEKEKKVFTNVWKRRQENIDKMYEGVSILGAELSSVIGNEMPKISSLIDFEKLEEL